MIDELLKKHRPISDQVSETELRVILRELLKTIEIEGDVVELGCYEGATSLFLARVLKSTNKRLWLYDSFEGLPEKTVQDSSRIGDDFKPGELNASKKNLIKFFKAAGLPMPRIKKAWFNQLTDADLPDKISFAFLDGDYYESIRDSLKLIENQLQPNSIIIVDDYQNEALLGVAKAVDEWLVGKNYKLRIEVSLAIITSAPSSPDSFRGPKH
jgi:O-methyltransferase